MSALVKSRTIEELIAAGPPQVFTDTSAGWKAIFVDWFETHEDGPKRKLYPAQSEMVLIDLLSYAFATLGQEAQFAVEQRWLAFARKLHLEVMSANNSTFRLLASPAVTTIEFQLAETLLTQTVIPVGTKISKGNVGFVTDKNLIIAVGQLTGEVGATCVFSGVVGNGFEPGEITSLDDDFTVELTITNTDISTGGADEEADEALLERAANAHDRISKAGPRESYRQQTRAYSSAIIAVAVTRPEPGDINVYPLLGTGAPDAAFLLNVHDWLDYEKKRPQGDDLFVLPPEAATFGIDYTVHGAGDLAALEAAVTAILTDASAIWSQELGAYLALAVLTCAANQITGVVDVEITITGLADRQLDEHQFAVLTGINPTMVAANV